MKPKVCFFTVCGGGEDYDFLLGSIWHHALMGQHLVLDTTPAPDVKFFNPTLLPPTVTWLHEPIYGRGWKEFKLCSALKRAMNLTLDLLKPDVLVNLDCDEFFSMECSQWAFPLAIDRMVQFNTVHWKRDAKAYGFGESEWHGRAWPASMDVKILRNEAWVTHPEYNGNPEHHPIPCPPEGASTIRAHGQLHHHLHYAIGSKASDLETAISTIPEWKTGGTPLPLSQWPDALVTWKNLGIRPSSFFF